MGTISSSMRKLATGLFSDEIEQQQFLTALIATSTAPRALLWVRPQPAALPFLHLPPIGFEPAFITRVAPDSRAGAQELHSDGYYYCLDFSSVFSASILQAIDSPIASVLDVCAAPGGKSIFAWRLLQPEILVCNDPIGSRIGALVSNLQRLRIPSSVTRHDSSILKERSPNSFDLVICDVPCSGQSLLARGKEAGGAFHPATINMNSNRQKRIVANAVGTVAPQGYLAYMTCTFSRAENESVIEWVIKKFPHLRAVPAPGLHSHQSPHADFPCYRIFPHSGIGAGAFACLLQSEETGSARPIDLSELTPTWQFHH